VVSSTPRPQFTPGKGTVPFVQEALLASWQVWKGGKSRPQRDSILYRPACSPVAIPTELPGPQRIYVHNMMSAGYQRPTFRTKLVHDTSELTTNSVLNGQTYKCRQQTPSETSVVNRHSTRCHKIIQSNVYIYNISYIYDIFVNCNWVDTRGNSTVHIYTQTVHRTTQ